MAREHVLQQIGVGTAAGLIGIAVIKAARSSNRTEVESVSVRRETPAAQSRAEMAGGSAGTSSVPGALKAAASTLRAFGYGSAGAAVFSALRERPRVLLDGSLIGLAIWAADRAGWLPNVGVTKPRRQESAIRTASSIAQHMVFGVASVTAYRRLRRSLAG